MGDFTLDLRPRPSRRGSLIRDAIRFHPSLGFAEISRDEFDLLLTHPPDGNLWAPYQTKSGCLFAVAGMAALNESDWEKASSMEGTGGLAAKAIANLYESGGLHAVEQVSGNCALIVFDAAAREVHLVNDAAGAFPVFECESADGWIFSSHPDILAAAAGEQERRDEVSMAEFAVASMVTPPFTFYERIRATAHGTTVSISVDTGAVSRRRHFEFEFRGSAKDTEQELAVELAEALKNSIRRRTHPRFGLPVIALSGGADSRLLLACMDDPSRALAFTCYDQPNRELKTAERVAAAFGTRHLLLQRSPDYYAGNAEEGVRISGGMGTFANNHFLGMLDRLRAEGMGTLLTGCYFDYLFKGLALNRRENKLTGREELAPYSRRFYFRQWVPSTPLMASVRERWDEHIPAAFRAQSTDAEVFGVESRRSFPLCYEGDNQQRVVPQRLTGWFLPVADRGVLDVYRRIPGRMKLNRSIFLRAANRLLEQSAAKRVPDANTGAPLSASRVREWFSCNIQRVQRKFRSVKRSLASDGSWPDWQYYVAHSARLAELWKAPNPDAFDFFRRVMGWSSVPGHPREFAPGETFLLVSLLTQKIWLHQRAGETLR